jgi:rhodanese-related sulfurtransferase
MKIDWAALGTVAAVSIAMSVVFTVLLAGGIRSVSAARLRRNQGANGTAVLAGGYSLLGLAGLLVLFGIWLIVPQFH